MHKLLRTAAFELQGTDSKQVVKVAGLMRRLQNWLRKLTSEEYADAVDRLQGNSAALQSTLDHINREIVNLQEAIRDGDVESYEEHLTSVKSLSLELTRDLKELNRDALPSGLKKKKKDKLPPAAKEQPAETEDMIAEVPVAITQPSTVAAPSSEPDATQVGPESRKWYTAEELKKTRQDIRIESRRQLIDRFGPLHDVPFSRKHSQPVRSYKWFQQFQPQDISLKDNPDEPNAVPAFLAAVKKEMVAKLGSLPKAERIKTIDMLVDDKWITQLIHNVQAAILDGTLREYDVNSVSQDVGHRPINQNRVVIRTGLFEIPGLNHVMDMNVLLTDMMSSRVSRKRLAMGKVWGLDMRPNVLSARPIVTDEEKKAERVDMLRKLAFGQQRKPYQVTNLNEVQLARSLAEGYQKVHGTAPTAEILGGGWAQVILESGRPVKLPNNNVGNIKATAEWVKSGKPYFVMDTGEYDGKGKYYLEKGTKWRAYATPADGAAGYWQLLGGRYKEAVAWMASGDPVSASIVLGEKGYFTANIRKYSSAVGKLFVEFMTKIAPQLPNIKSSPAPVPGVKPAMKEWKNSPVAKQAPAVPAAAPADETDMKQVDNLMNSLYASGPVEQIVRHSIARSVLPTSDVLVSIANLTAPFKDRLQFAKSAAYVLRDIVDADTSIHTDGDKIEVQCAAAGSLFAVAGAIQALCACVGDAMLLKSNVTIDYMVFPDATSEYNELTE